MLKFLALHDSGCSGFFGYDVALHAASGLSSFGLHVANVHPRVLGVGVGDQQGCHVVLHRDPDPRSVLGILLDLVVVMHEL